MWSTEIGRMIIPTGLRRSSAALTRLVAWAVAASATVFAQAASPGDIWVGVQLAGKTSFPCRLSKHSVAIIKGASLVHAVEQSRVTRQKTRAGRDAAGNYPTLVDIRYRIEQVLVGDKSLEGKYAEATACKGMFEDYSNDPTVFDWVPSANGGVISLAKIESGKARIYSTSVAGFSLPLECGEGDIASWPPRNSCLESVIADFKHTNNTSDFFSQPTRMSPEELGKKTNLYQVWALWNLGGDTTGGNINTLMQYCNRESPNPLLQCLADSKIMQSSRAEEWRYSEERKLMYGRWISLDGDQLAYVIFRYLSFVVRDWGNVGYGKTHFEEQITRRLEDVSLGVIERRRLERLLQSIDR